MTTAAKSLFSTVPERDYLGLLEGKAPKHEALNDFFGFTKNDVASAAGVPVGSVRYDSRMPEIVRQRMTEWATLINLVAQFFEGDVEKTALWFGLPNPLLGNVSPRDMIRLGRYETLRDMIHNSLFENQP